MIKIEHKRNSQAFNFFLTIWNILSLDPPASHFTHCQGQTTDIIDYKKEEWFVYYTKVNSFLTTRRSCLLLIQAIAVLYVHIYLVDQISDMKPTEITHAVQFRKAWRE